MRRVLALFFMLTISCTPRMAVFPLEVPHDLRELSLVTALTAEMHLLDVAWMLRSPSDDELIPVTFTYIQPKDLREVLIGADTVRQMTALMALMIAQCPEPTEEE